MTQYMPPGVQKWGFTEILSAWMDGKLGMIITWPPIGRWSEGVGLMIKQLSWVPPTKGADKVGYAPEPGGRSLPAGNFALGISVDSKNAALSPIPGLFDPLGRSCPKNRR